jgi:hypothetical protein
MAADRFKSAEDEYFRLKGLLDAKRITQTQCEDALKQMIVGDALGRNWILGVDDGKWYVHDGKSWVRAEPYPASPANVPFAAMPVVMPVAIAPPRQTSSLRIIVLIGGIVVVCLLGIIGVLVASQMGIVRIAFGATPTRYTIPTPMIFVAPPQPLAPMPAPLPTALPTATATTPPTATATATSTPTATLTPTLAATPTLTPRPQGNCADPGAKWENVVDGQTLEPYAAFIGTANHENFEGYVVEWFRPGNVLHRSTTPVKNGVIFVWNTYTVENGEYPVALIVYLKDGTNLAPCVVRVRVAR